MTNGTLYIILYTQLKKQPLNTKEGDTMKIKFDAYTESTRLNDSELYSWVTQRHDSQEISLMASFNKYFNNDVPVTIIVEIRRKRSR